MKCPKCQHENPDEARFCIECGNPIEFQCPKCGAKTPRTGKFCMECGYNLSKPSESIPKELSFDEKIEKIQKYLPGGLTEKILSQRGKIEGERKQVTVMFADMAGFTPLVEKLGPEEAYSIMDQIYEILIHKVHEYEGTVNEMTGDGVMALFGAPIAIENAPQRAIQSASAIHRELTRFSNQKTNERFPSPLKMRIGIHTGPVVVGTLGNDLRVEFKAVGDTVNLASRMEALAEPGTTCVTEDTFKLTEGLYRFETLGEKTVKGKEDLIRVYRVIAPSTLSTRFEVSAERGLTPFVGRVRELELLLDGFERAKAGRGQAFSIISEAGIGKTRLLYEFRKAIANEDITFLEGKCLSYSKGAAYHPIMDILKSSFNIQEDDSDFDTMEKTKRGLKLLGIAEDSTLPYLLEFLSVKDSGISPIMSLEARHERTMEAITRITLKSTELRTLILAFEDLHWVDKGSEGYLKDLMDVIPGARIFIIYTYRPEFIHTWGSRSYHSQINLTRLSNRESLLMVSHLLGTEDINRNLEELILDKSEGIPFFIEEFVKSLKDLKLIEKKNNQYRLIEDIRKISIPSTIQDVIMARVDALPDRAKEILQTGSVIEREFSYELIKAATGLPEKELLSNLSILKDSEVLFERGIYPDSTYVFKHALTRDVVYNSILSDRKKILHGLIGQAIEERYQSHLDQYYGMIAEHYFESENYVKAAEFYRRAAKKAERVVLFEDAIAYAAKFVLCIEKLPKTQETEKRLIDARTILGFYYTQSFRFDEVKRAIDPIIELAEKHDYKRRLAQIYYMIGVDNLFIREDLTEGTKYLKKAIKIGEETNNLNALILSNHYLGHVYSENCEFEKGYQHINKALQIVKQFVIPWSIAMHTSCIALNVYYLSGKIDLAYRTSLEGLRMAEDSGDILSKFEAYGNHGICAFGKGLFDEAEEYLSRCIEISKKSEFYTVYIALSQSSLGDVFQWKGEYQKALECYMDALSYEGSGVTPSAFNLGKIQLANAKVMTNDKHIDLNALYNIPPQVKIRRLEGLARRSLGELLLNLGEDYLPQAEQWISQAVEADKKNGMKFFLGLDTISYAELFKRKGDKLKAKETLGKAIEILKECGADGWVEKYEKELVEIS